MRLNPKYVQANCTEDAAEVKDWAWRFNDHLPTRLDTYILLRVGNPWMTPAARREYLKAINI